MITSGSNQVLHAQMTFGMAPLGGAPDYDGFAIGDLLVRDYSPEHSAIYFAQQRRLQVGDKYQESQLIVPVDEVNDDAFSLWWVKEKGNWQPYFSGTRTPSTKTQFGCYGPIPNGHRFHLPLELVLVPDGNKRTKFDSRKKRTKLGNQYARLAGIVAQVNRQVKYKISGEKMDSNPESVKPWGLSDAISIQDETRTLVDEVLQPNQDYMFGHGVVGRVRQRPTQTKPWEARDEESYEYMIELQDNVRLDFADGGDIESNDDSEGGARPWSRPAIQQVAIASISNSRSCWATEIGIKSEVWRQMTGSVNFNGWPKNDLIEDYEDDGGSITVGSMTKYMKRYTFFELHVRELNDDPWINLTGDKPFAIRGTSPTIQYNTIYVNHPGGRPSIQEYKLLPVPGARYYDRFLRGETMRVRLLNGRELYNCKVEWHVPPGQPVQNAYNIAFTGQEVTLTQVDVTNPEWIFNFSGDLDRIARGPIVALESNQTSGVSLPPVVPGPDVFVDEKYKPQGDDQSLVRYTKANGQQFIWNGRVRTGTFDPNGRWVEYTKDGQDIRLYREDLKQAYSPSVFVDAPNSPRYVVRDKPPADPLTDSGFVACVYKYNVNGVIRYRYKWSDITVATTTSKTKNWQLDPTADTRYRIKLKDNGNYSNPITEESIEWLDHPIFVNLFDLGTLTRPTTGAALNPDTNRWEFYRDGRKLGTGPNVEGDRRNLYIGQFQASDRWRAQQREFTEEPEREEIMSTDRICNEDKDDDFQDVVTTGVILMYKDGVPEYVTVRNPNNPSQTKQKHKMKMFVNDVKVLNNVPVEDYFGNRTVYRDPVTNFEFRPYKIGEDDPPIVGNANQKSPCYRVRTVRILPARWEQRAITYQNIIVTPEAWEIEKQTVTTEIPEEFSISKYEVNNTTFEEPEIFETILKGEKEEDEEGDRSRNKTARVRVLSYQNVYSDKPKKRAYSWEIIDGGEGYKTNEKILVGDTGEITSVKSIKTDDDQDNDEDTGWNNLTKDGSNYFPINAICDYYINNTDTSSHANGPEHSICFVNELIKTKEFDEVPQYYDLAMAGIKITNSKEWTSFNDFSAWVAEGIEIEHLFTEGGRKSIGPSNLFPEIAYALLTDARIGAGQSIGAESVDRNAMKKAARFCEANEFFWDGVVAESINLREFIFSNAAYILCDFTIKGGQFALVPAFPYNPTTFRLTPKAKPEIKALFTDGNMKEGSMKVTFLSPEERQLFKAVVLYRREIKNGFAETLTMTTYLKAGADGDPVEEFDLTQFCTSESQARKFSRVALKLRQLVDHGITFETTPQSAMTLEPGDYFKVATQVTHTDRFQSGMIDDKGNVATSDPAYSSSFNIVYWRPGDTGTKNATLTYANGKTKQTALYGTIWARVMDTENTRVYKCETLSYADDGLVAVTGSITPLTDSGTLAVIDYDNSEFVEEII